MSGLLSSLTASELLQILAQYPLGVLLSELDGTIAWANDSACRALRQPPEALLGQHLTRLVPMGLGEARSEQRLRTLQADGTLDTPARYDVVLPDGAARCLEVSTQRLQRPPPTPPLLCTLVRDVTGEVEAAARIQERERRLQQLAAATTEGLVFHQDLRITDCNPAMARMLHTTVEDVIGSRVEEFLDPEAMSEVRPVIAARQEGSYAFTVRRRDGTTFPAELSARPVQVGEGWQRVVSVRDISARKAAEDALEDVQARFAALSHAAPVGLARFTAALELEACNASWAQQVGGTEADLLGDSWRRCIYPDHADKVIADMRETAATGQPGGGVFRVVTPDSSERWLEGHFSAQGGRLDSFISVLLDVTARIQAERQRARALREKEVLLKEVHHRVKNNLLLVSSLLLLQQVQSDSPQLARIFGNLHARIDAMALVHKLVYQSEALSQVSADTYSRALIDGLQSSMRPPGTQVSIVASVAPLRMEVSQAIPFGLLLNELLTNALQHAFVGRDTGRISVTFAAHPQQPGRWCLCVADDGVGLPHGRPRAETLGTQLIHMLTEQLEGTVHQETVPGQGLVTTIDFPLHHRSDSARA